MKKEELKIVFMGTPEFAVPSLQKLVDSDYKVVAVITAPDKPAGRGKKVTFSAVKQRALQLGLPILQPENLKDSLFIKQLESYQANLQIVVAFRMLPEVVWSMPEYGTFNLHASLLPQYRGAAPINHAIINGEKETGLTTFFLDKEIDTGAIIKQVKVSIADGETASSLHDRMMLEGAKLVLETIQLLLEGKTIGKDQSKFISPGTTLNKAPKLNKEDCRINWDKSGKQIVNFIRGLSSYPTAFSEFISENGDILYIKIFSAFFEKTEHSIKNGVLSSDNKSYIKIAVEHGFVFLTELQQAGKKKLDVNSFLRGSNFSGNWIAKN
ncbi:MAG TPA: methionyl-tRNA formyltransferase [Bacteroidales bacterium]